MITQIIEYLMIFQMDLLVLVQHIVMKVGGANTTGIQTGGSLLLLNGIFQTPTTENNQGNNYDFIGDTTAGITTITFTGITSTDGTTKVTSESDVNLNQLPRGGMIVSLGSTGGLGVAPLVGAAVTAVKNNAGQITAVGVGTLLIDMDQVIEVQ